MCSNKSSVSTLYRKVEDRPQSDPSRAKKRHLAWAMAPAKKLSSGTSNGQRIKRARIQPNYSGEYVNNIRGRNIYEDLQDDDDMSGISTIEDGGGNANPAAKKPPAPPPITVVNISIKELIDCLRTLEGTDLSALKYKLTSNGIKIFTPDNATFVAVSKHCVDKKLAGFSHVLKENRHVRFCLYGLWSMDISELANELKAKNIEPVKINQLTLKEANKRYTDQAIYLVYFKKSQNVKLDNLRQITGLFNVVVSWKYYKPSQRGPTQCSRCQQLGHGTENCFKPAVCVRCAGAHESKQCPHIIAAVTGQPAARPRIPEDKVKCALCGKSGHTAASRDCEAKAEYQAEQQRVRARQAPQRRRQVLPRFDSRREFPAPAPRAGIHPLATSYHIYRPAPEAPTSSQWRPSMPSNNGSMRLLSSGECMKLFDYFTTELLQCTTVEQQIRAVAKLAFEQVQKYSNVSRSP